MKKRLLVYLTMMIVVPLAGEMKFFPIQEDVRVSLGTPVFFFILLLSREIQPIVSGILVGISVISFRIFLGIHSGDMLLEEAFGANFPVFFYYVTFASLFYLFNIKKMSDNPLLIGVLGVIIEIFASMIEIGLRSFYSHVPIALDTLVIIGGIAIIRSFFVLGFFNLFVIREARLAEEEQRKQNEQMLVLISNLYIEMVQLKKTMKDTEQLTIAGYKLYRDLREVGHNDFSKTALKLAFEMHEIKKDNQRIYAGLSKLMAKENLSDYMSISEIIHVIRTGNERYSDLLGKNILFMSNISGLHPLYHTFILLSVINNLVSNAVEAIEENGEILIETIITKDILDIRVKDNGVGISPRNRPLIFTPGFTTKFDSEGMASTGIGLSYVKNVIKDLGGNIRLEEPEIHFKTVFAISLPIESLTERG
jgi:two-component system sensor histidine kinase YcbA